MAINYKEELAKAAIGIASTLVGTVITIAMTTVAENIGKTDDTEKAYNVIAQYKGVKNLSFTATHKINSAATKILQAEADRFASACKRTVEYTSLSDKDSIYADIDNRFVVRGKVTITNIQQRYSAFLNEITEIAKMYKLRISVTTDWPTINAISEH